MVKRTGWGSACEIVLKHANPGDLIEFFDPAFRHWAVYAADNDGKPMLVHFYQWNKKAYTIQYDLVEEVADGRDCRVHNKYDDRESPYDKNTIMQRAVEAVKGESINRSYDATSWNCEHFATWLRCGVAFSDQATGRNLVDPVNWMESLGGFIAHGVRKASGSSSSSSSGNKSEKKKFAAAMNAKYGA